MLFALPTRSTIRPTSYLVPEPYEYHPSYDFYSHYDAPQFTAPSYPSRLDFFRQPSAEELEEHAYRQALEVVANHRRRQAEKEAMIRRQQIAKAAQRHYAAIIAAEVEQRRQEELLAVRRAELFRSQQARARLAAAKRQHGRCTFMGDIEGPQQACSPCLFVTRPNLIRSQIIRQPHAARCGSPADVFSHRLPSEFDTDISGRIRKIISSLEPRSAEPEERKASNEDLSDSSEDPAKLIEGLLSSIFPGLVFRTQPEPAPSAEKAQPSPSDKGKGKARAVDVKEPQEPAPKPDSTDDAFANILRHVMELSKSIRTPRSPDEAGPSGTSSSSSAPTKSTVRGKEQAQIDRAVALSSVEHIQNTLTKLQKDFVLPTDLEHYPPSTDDRDETASVASASSSDLTKLIPYTRANKSVYKYESELNSLLGELDRIDSHGDAEVREKRKEVVQAVEKALEDIESVIGETVGKRLSLISATPTATDEPVKGFDASDDFTKIDPVQVEETIVPTESAPTGGARTETEAPVPESTADLPVEQSVPGSDVEVSMATITPPSIEVSSVTETELTGSQVAADAPETTNTSLSSDKISPPPSVQKPQQTENDVEDEVASFGSDAEKSDWSEVEH